MEIKLSDNIRAMRKRKSLTQEQLAEAMGVTVGAVSKWESGQSTPELGLIMELADFFETSVDTLLGYEWRSGGMGKAAERIHECMLEKKYAAGTVEADKALQKYPNCFDVVYYSARFFCMKGFENGDKKILRRSLELYRRAGELIDLCTDDEIGDITIQNRIAEVYLMLGESEKAIEQFKKNNYESLNSCAIGCVLAAQLHRPEEALPYLSNSLWTSVMKLMRCASGFVDAFIDMKKYEDGIEILNWILGIFQGLKKPGVVSYLDRSEVMLLTGCAQLSVCVGSESEARRYLHLARVSAESFDAAPEYSIGNMKYWYDKSKSTAFDDFGGTAMNGIEQSIAEYPETSEILGRLWSDELK